MLKLHLNFQVWTLLTTQLVVSIVHFLSMFCCPYPLNQTQVLWSLKTLCLWCVCCYLIIPMGICILHYAHGGESMDTWMGVEHFCIHCLWGPFLWSWWWKYGVWTDEWEWNAFSSIVCDANFHVICEQMSPLISSNFYPLIKCIEQFPWTQRIDCTPWWMSSSWIHFGWSIFLAPPLHNPPLKGDLGCTFDRQEANSFIPFLFGQKQKIHPPSLQVAKCQYPKSQSLNAILLVL